MATDKLKGFRIKLDRDFQAIARQTQGLQSELKGYFRDQERLVPADTSDIDAYLVSNMDHEGAAELSKRRQELQARCDRLYEAICLLIALSLFAGESVPEDIDQAIFEMGFMTKVEVVPILDWDAVGRVTVSTFVMMLAFNGLYVALVNLLRITDIPFVPDRSIVTRFAIIYTLVYAIVMWLAIRLKRRWRRKGLVAGARPENFLIAIYAYVLTAPFNLAIGVIFRGWVWNYAPFLFALNQAIFGYFIGLYIDRSLKTDRISLGLAVLQGVAQGVGATIAMQLAPNLPSGMNSNLLIGVFSLLQAMISGSVVGVLFQHFYKQTKSSLRDMGRGVSPNSRVSLPDPTSTSGSDPAPA
jgi:hypothetical protein